MDWTLLVICLCGLCRVSSQLTNESGDSSVQPAYQCLWHNNSCVDDCPEWMVEVKSDCSQTYGSAQRTCEHPELTLVGLICGASRCDCPGSTVLDTDTGYCYEEDNCPTKHSL